MLPNTNLIFPLPYWHLQMLPTKTEPGSFGFVRKYDIHCGVDLYVDENNPSEHGWVVACENGVVVNLEDYTGPNAGSPWWLETRSILVAGQSGVICYGEVNEYNLKIGDAVLAGQKIGYVRPVLKKKPNINIPNHSRYMLHFELYKHGTNKSVWWHPGEPQPENLLDPTELLETALKNRNVLAI